MLTDPVLNLVAKEREKLFLELYKACFPAVAKYVSKRGGDFEQAKDVFQDALVIYYEKIKAAKLGPGINEKAYIFGIAKHLWTRRYNQNIKIVALDENNNASQEEAAHPSSKKMLRYLETAGQKCMELLRAFYYDQLKLEDIAGAFGFSGTRSATVQKFKCLEKVREKIKEKSLVYEDFFE